MAIPNLKQITVVTKAPKRVCKTCQSKGCVGHCRF